MDGLIWLITSASSRKLTMEKCFTVIPLRGGLASKSKCILDWFYRYFLQYRNVAHCRIWGKKSYVGSREGINQFVHGWDEEFWIIILVINTIWEIRLSGWFHVSVRIREHICTIAVSFNLPSTLSSAAVFSFNCQCFSMEFEFGQNLFQFSVLQQCLYLRQIVLKISDEISGHS